MRLDYLLLALAHVALVAIGLVERPLHYTFLAGLLGSATGAVIAILTSPYESERAEFSNYAKLISSFFTGYAVSKFDRIFEVMMQDGQRAVMLSPPVLFRTGYFLAAMFSTFLLVMTYRRYEVGGQTAGVEPAAVKK